MYSSDQLTRKIGKFSVVLVLWSLLTLLWMAKFHPYAILSVLLVVPCLFFQNRLKLDAKPLAATLIVPLLLCFACTRALDFRDNGHFFGIGTFCLAMLGSWLLGYSLVLVKPGVFRRAPLSFGTAILILCSMSLSLRAVLVLASVGIFLLAFALRENEGLSFSPAILLPLFLTLSLMAGLSAAATWSESKVSYLMSIFALTPPTGMRFPPTSGLRSLQRHHTDELVVLRGYGENPPLYLVGRSFTKYEDKGFWKWGTSKEELKPQDQVLLDTLDGRRAISFFNKKGDNKQKPFRLEYPKAGQGFTIYAPRHYAGVAVDLERLHLYGDGRLEVLAKDGCSGEYFLYPFADGWVRQGKARELQAEENEECLALPEGLTPVVSEMAEEIAGKADTPLKKAAAITRYLQTNYTYGYDYPFDPKGNPLEEFLVKKPPAHCEFFATSAALMLRAQGVPTRYINGFVLQERSLTGDYYVVRLKHAHAWIEVYIPGQGWVTYDPTPPGVLDDANTKSHMGKALIEWFSNTWRKFFNFFSLNPKQMFLRIKATLSQLTWKDLVGVALLFVCAYLWKRYREHLKQNKPIHHEILYRAPRHEQLSPLLDQLNAQVRPAEWKRAPQETPQQWQLRLKESNLEQQTLDSLDEFLKHYYACRFGSKEIDFGSLRSKCESLSRDLGKQNLEEKAAG